MSQAISQIPAHLKKYIVDQNYQRYTPQDQAVWRFIMRQLIDFLSLHAHPAYIEGLRKTGIEVEQIPHISKMDEKLSQFGWRAVPVSGFIPPAAFMEFQSLSILPIASDMRSIQHLQYTPAPDIVHEAAGHAPILIDPKFAAYLKKYAEVARKAIVNREDIAQYEAIRKLSDLKEHPSSTPQQIKAAEDRLNQVNLNIHKTSEAGWLSRMNWWTAEYGLFGSLSKPLIFGAGLLSSVGESRWCLNPKVKKLPLTVECVDVGYDITEPQPQLFVTEDFDQLHDVLIGLTQRMSFVLGGQIGLNRALDSGTVNTVVLNTGLEISGMLTQCLWEDTSDRCPTFIKFTGPVQISANGHELDGHGVNTHSHGFSAPLGTIRNFDLTSLRPHNQVRLDFESGFWLEGEFQFPTRVNGQIALLRFDQCTVGRGDEIYYQKDWGLFDLALGTEVVSVYAGASDRHKFPLQDDFTSVLVPDRKVSSEQNRLFGIYDNLRQLRREGIGLQKNERTAAWDSLYESFERAPKSDWLVGIELIELIHLLELSDRQNEQSQIATRLQALTGLSAQDRECIQDGLKLAKIRL